MNNSNKPKRRYNSERRKAQAEATRGLIIEAARRQFSAHGYVGATMDAIGRDAGVAAETVYAVFGNKRAILSHLIAVSVRGDDGSAPLLDQAGPRAVMREPDPRRQLAMFAGDIAGILARVAPVFEIMNNAAKSDSEIAALRANILDERLQNMTKFVRQLSVRSPFRTGLTELQAAETVWALTSPELFRLLTSDRGWSAERYSAWLAEGLIGLLLPSEPQDRLP